MHGISETIQEVNWGHFLKAHVSYEIKLANITSKKWAFKKNMNDPFSVTTIESYGPLNYLKTFVFIMGYLKDSWQQRHIKLCFQLSWAPLGYIVWRLRHLAIDLCMDKFGNYILYSSRHIFSTNNLPICTLAIYVDILIITCWSKSVALSRFYSNTNNKMQYHHMQ